MIPNGWVQRWAARADLEASYRELEASPGWFAWTCRGRLLSFGARFRVADRMFREAARRNRLVTEASESFALATLQHAAMARENGLLLGRPSGRVGPLAHLRAASERLCRVLETHRALDGAEALIEGEASEAEEIFCELRGPHRSHEALAAVNMALAACKANQGRQGEATELLEISGLHLAAAESLATRARLGCRLESLWELLGRKGEALAWRSTLEALPCPPTTLRAFRARARYVARKSSDLGYCVVL